MAAREGNLGSLDIRPLTTIKEFEATLPLQRQIWGFEEAELVASRLFGVFARIGGSCLGAYLDDEIVGYALAFAALKPDLKPYWHSHMAGVAPSAQNLGIGRLLKLRQRDEALAAGIECIEWTFDPLQARNAYFNIERLGTRIEAYIPNFYGITSSKLHGSLPTDRLVAAWRLRDANVERRLSGRALKRPTGRLRIEVPARVGELPRSAALQVQSRLREQFRAAFEASLSVTGFERTDTAGIYHFDKRTPESGSPNDTM